MIITDDLKALYLKEAYKYCQILIEYEHAPIKIVEISDGQETKEFLEIWFKSSNERSSIISDIISDWNHWYKEVVN